MNEYHNPLKEEMVQYLALLEKIGIISYPRKES